MRTLITLVIVANTLLFSAQTVTNGSATSPTIGVSVVAPGWTNCAWSPDICDINTPSFWGTSQVTASSSPDGGTWIGLFCNNTVLECVSTTITGLTPGNSYTIQFYGACFGTGLSFGNQGPAGVTLTVGSTTQTYSVPMVASTWNTYTFTFTASAATEILTLENQSVDTYVSLDGFTIITPLPIELTQFNAKVGTKNNSVILDWQTASETNNDFFTIERLQNGSEWAEVIQVDGAGNSTSPIDYRAIDYSPFSGISYYRLKQTDFDGNYEYSEIRSVNINNSDDSNFLIYPNPTTNQITISGNQSELQEISIYNALGQDVTSLVKQNKMDNELKVEVDLSELVQGIYYVRTKSTTNKILKQ